MAAESSSQEPLDAIESAVDAEMAATLRQIDAWPVDPCVLLMQIVRFLDARTVASWMNPELDRTEHLFFRMGFNPLLGSLLPKIGREVGFPLMATNDYSRQLVATALHHVGRLQLLKRHLQLARSRVMTLERNGARLAFRRTSDEVGVEVLAQLDRAWTHGELAATPLPVPAEIRAEMRALVYQFRRHFIGYETSPAIDAHFLIVTAQIFDEERDLHGISPEFQIESMSGTEITAVAALLASIYLKHVAFCSQYVQKFAGSRWDNIITTFDEQHTLTNTVADFARYVHELRPKGEPAIYDLSRKKVHQCLTALSVHAGNVAVHAQRLFTPMPPLIQVRRNFWIRPISSLTDGALAFGALEFRRRYRKAWDGNLRLREAWFRRDLYALFAGNRYVCLEHPKQLSAPDRTLTDIDAAVLDVTTGRLALFELKWQDPIGFEEAERRSRARNLRAEVFGWVAKVSGFMQARGIPALAEQLGLPASAPPVRAVELFVLARHNARFSGVRIGHPQAAVAGWRQFTRARIELGPRDDTFAELFRRSKEEEQRVPPLESAVMGFSVAGFDVEADQFSMASDLPGNAASAGANSTI